MSGATATAMARGQVYGLLATIFRRPLDAAHLQRLRTDEMLAALSAAGVDAGRDFATGDGTALLDRLATDYTQLFHGPGEHIAPYESIQRGMGDELMGPGADAVQRFMAKFGYSITPEAGEMPDHISVELAFMAELARREADARAAGDQAAVDLITGLQRRFLTEHLGRWAGGFATKIRREAWTPFYRSMAQLLADFVADEQRVAAA